MTHRLTTHSWSAAAAAGTSLIHVNGRWVRLDTQQLRATLKRLHKQRAETGEMSAAALIRLAAESTADPSSLEVRGEGWIEQLLDGLPDERLSEVDEPPEFVGALRHYQRRGLSWMQFLGRIGLGGCLADDMGLGKTATTLAHLATRPGPHLVVCPLSVVHNWYAEAARFTPHLQVEIHHGTDRAAAASKQPSSSRRPTLLSPPMAYSAGTSTPWPKCNGELWCLMKPRRSRTI